jgi:hypothetical protein
LTSGTSYSPPPAFGRFKLLHQIGAGVLGPVFRTHDPDHERLVAVKAFTLDLTPEQAEALAAELTRLAALGIDAPYVAAPLAAGIEEYVPYVAVPHVSGESLDAAIRQYGPAPAGDAMRLIKHVAEALDAASHAGVHHGSLHPRDIIVTPGDTHVTGLGVAQALGRVGLHGPIRRPYVAPEREGGDEWGAPADIYALAAIAYEVLTGRRALPGTDQPLPGFADLHVHDAAALREIVEAAFDADPGRRPARARDFAAAFAAALSESGAGAAPGERVADRRPRKPRPRPHKLPGLDEPLTDAEAPSAPKAKTPVPAVFATSSAPAADPAPELISAAAASGAEPGAGREPAGVRPPADDSAFSEIRYVPVSDPADAGEVESAPPDAPAAAPVAPRETEPARVTDAVRAIDHPEAIFTSGATPDLRLVDELLARADAGGESVDADLAAALDRVTLHLASGPTPAVIGLDRLGSGPATTQAIEEIASAGLDLDLAAAAPVDHRLPEVPEPAPGPMGAPTAPPAWPMPERTVPEVPAAPGGQPAERHSPADAFTPAADDVAGVPMGAAPPRGRQPDLAAGDASLPPLEPVEAAAGADQAAPAAPRVAGATPTPGGETEPPKPFVRGRGGERRRPPSRYSRIDLTPPPAEESSDAESGVPRALDTARSTPPQRPTTDFELLTRPSPVRSAAVPVVVGVAAGLILGLAGGYWLGSRSAPAGAPAPAAVAAVTRAPAPPEAPDARAEPARSEAAGPAAAGRAPSGPPPPAPTVPAATAVRPAPAGPAPPASERPARSPAGATPGAIQVTASQQANVYLDGVRSGLTPRSLRNVPLGSHVIRITRPGYEPQEQTVVLTAEEPSAALSFTLRRGTGRAAAGQQAPAVRSVLTVFIDSIPQGARIRIDGRDLAATPLMVRQLRPGTHTLELRLPGYRPWTQRLTVAAGDDRRITATLERDTTR